MSVKALQTKLLDDQKCTIAFDMVWKRKNAMIELYGSWEVSFGLLFNWKAQLMRLISNCVVEIDVEFKDDMP